MKFIALCLFLFVFTWTALVMPPGMSKFPKVKVNLKERSGQTHTIEFDTKITDLINTKNK